MNKIEIKDNEKNTTIYVNGEFVATIKGKVKKQDIPIVGNDTIGRNQRYGNCHGYVWVSI